MVARAGLARDGWSCSRALAVWWGREIRWVARVCFISAGAARLFLCRGLRGACVELILDRGWSLAVLCFLWLGYRYPSLVFLGPPVVGVVGERFPRVWGPGGREQGRYIGA